MNQHLNDENFVNKGGRDLRKAGVLEEISKLIGRKGTSVRHLIEFDYIDEGSNTL